MIAYETDTLKFHRNNIRCAICRMTTNSKRKAIRHYNDCPTQEQSTLLLAALRIKMEIAATKRALTIARKAAEQLIVNGDVVKVNGNHGIYSVRANNCNCPGHVFRGNCKHIAQVTSAVKAAALVLPSQLLQSFGIPRPEKRWVQKGLLV